MTRPLPRGGCASVAVPPPVTTTCASWKRRRRDGRPSRRTSSTLPAAAIVSGSASARSGSPSACSRRSSRRSRHRRASLKEVQRRQLGRRSRLGCRRGSTAARSRMSGASTANGIAPRNMSTGPTRPHPLDEIRRADILAWLRELEAKHVDYEGQRVGWARRKAAQDRANGKTPKRRARRSASTKTKTLGRQPRIHRAHGGHQRRAHEAARSSPPQTAKWATNRSSKPSATSIWTPCPSSDDAHAGRATASRSRRRRP